ncbi:MAG: DUF3795 domain-containing protein [Planctomycetota bacterium]
MDISSCGMVCQECNAFIAHKNDDDGLRAETAKLWTEQYKVEITPEDVNCTGCREEGAKIGHCHVCEIRTCCIEKDVANCGKCDEFACEKLEGFFKMFPDGGAENRARLTND